MHWGNEKYIKTFFSEVLKARDSLRNTDLEGYNIKMDLGEISYEGGGRIEIRQNGRSLWTRFSWRQGISWAGEPDYEVFQEILYTMELVGFCEMTDYRPAFDRQETSGDVNI